MYSKNNGITWTGQVKNSVDIKALEERAQEIPVAVYKHDSNNMLSRMNIKNIHMQWTISPNQMEVYALDTHSYSSAGNIFCTTMGIPNQNPQFVILYKDNLIYHAINNAILVKDIQAALDKHFPIAENIDLTLPAPNADDNYTPPTSFNAGLGL